MVLLGLAALLFVTFYLILAFFNRPAGDDIMYLWKLEEHGWFRSWLNFDYNVRWAGYLLFDTIFVCRGDYLDLPLNIFIFHLASITLSVFSFRALIRAFTARLELTNLTPLVVWIYATLATAGLFFATSQHIEIWFWVIAMTVYLWGVLLSIRGAAYIIDPKHNAGSWAGLIACFAFVGGTMEHYVLLLATLLSVFIFVQFRKAGYHWQTIYRNKTILKTGVGLAAMLLVFAFTMAGNGVTQRIGYEQEFIDAVRADHPEQYTVGYEIKRLLHYLGQRKNLVFVLLLLPWWWIAPRLQKNPIIQSGNRKRTQGWVAKSLLLILVSMFFCFVPMWIIYGNLGAARTWLPINLFAYLSAVLLSLHVGWHYRIHEKWRNITAAMVALGIAGIMVTYVVVQFPIVSQYAQAHDARIEYLLDQPDVADSLIELEPLPDSGMLIYAKMEPQPEHIFNESLVKLLGKKFRITEEAKALPEGHYY